VYHDHWIIHGSTWKSSPFFCLAASDQEALHRVTDHPLFADESHPWFAETPSLVFLLAPSHSLVTAIQIHQE